MGRKYFEKKQIGLSLLMGLFIGIVSKLVDLVPGNTWLGYLGIKDLFNYFGIFIIAVCLIEYTAPSIKCGIFQTFSFMFSMVFGYYITTWIVYKHIPYRYILVWCLVALGSGVLCWMISLRRKDGLAAVLGILSPILLLGNEGCKFIRSHDYNKVQLWIEIIAILTLFWKFPLNKKHRMYSIVVFVILIPYLHDFNVIKLFGNTFFKYVSMFF